VDGFATSLILVHRQDQKAVDDDTLSARQGHRLAEVATVFVANLSPR
jgi:hypothetical protein